MSSGIFGFVLSANFMVQDPSDGCSGSLFGLLALQWIDLIQHWKIIRNRGCELIKLLSITILALFLGLLPFFLIILLILEASSKFLFDQKKKELFKIFFIQ